MRAQISLQFDDVDLFQNFITPYKEGRVLNSLIIKCLSAYYYNEEVRNLIEGTSIEDATDGEDIKTNQSLCDNIRASLLMQDFLASELQNTINNGTEDVENILRQTNDFAKESGVAKSTTSEYGSNMLQISMKEPKQLEHEIISQQTDESISDSTKFDILIHAVLKLAEASGNSEVVSMLHQSPSSRTDKEVQVSTETSSSDHVSKVLQTDESIVIENRTEVKDSKEVKEDFVVEEVVSTSNDFDNDVVDVNEIEATSNIIGDVDNSNNDASDAIKELLGSL